MVSRRTPERFMQPSGSVGWAMASRILAFTIVLAVSGLVPLLANGGSCYALPCCGRNETTIGAADTDCCIPANCVRDIDGLTAAGSVYKEPLRADRAMPPLLSVRSGLILQKIGGAPRPLRVSERLAKFSILLI